MIYRYLLFFCFFFCASLSPLRADVSTNNYSDVLNTIKNQLVVIKDSATTLQARVIEILDIVEYIGDIVDQNLPTADYWSNLIDQITYINSTLGDFKTSVDNYLAFMQNDLMSISSNSSSIYDILHNYIPNISSSLSSLDQWGSNFDELAQAIRDAASSAAQMELTMDDLNREQTQQDILDALEDIRGRITVFPEEDIHTIAQICAHIYDVVGMIYNTMRDWDLRFKHIENNYFSQFEDGIGDLTYSYYTLIGSPDWLNGYQTHNNYVDIHANNFVSSLFEILKQHLNMLVSINDIALFIAHNISSNGQEQAQSDFESQRSDVVSSLMNEYDSLSQIHYQRIQYDLQDSKLYSIYEFMYPLAIDNYEALKVHNVSIHMDRIDQMLPSTFEFRYDVSSLSTYFELCRSVFTVFWILFFASFWLYLVSLFYRFIHFLYRLLCMVPGQSAPPPGPGLPVPSGGGGAVMA